LLLSELPIRIPRSTSPAQAIPAIQKKEVEI